MNSKVSSAATAAPSVLIQDVHNLAEKLFKLAGGHNHWRDQCFNIETYFIENLIVTFILGQKTKALFKRLHRYGLLGWWVKRDVDFRTSLEFASGENYFHIGRRSRFLVAKLFTTWWHQTPPNGGFCAKG